MHTKTMFVYIMANHYAKPTLYIGVTNNIILRVQQHKTEINKGFTSRYHLHNLVYYEIIEGQEQAIIREKQIKNLSRQEKLDLIKKENPKLHDLYYHMCTTLAE